MLISFVEAAGSMTHVVQGPIAQAPVAAQLPATTLPALQSQLGDLQIQLSGLQAQWKGLRVQLDQMLQTNPARPGVVQQWADVGVHVAQVQGDIAAVQARIAQKQGVTVGTTAPAQAHFPAGIDQNIAVPLGALFLLAFVLPLSIGWARRIARGGRPQPAASLPHDQVSRLERMEQAIDTIAIEMERVSEGQRFVTKILAERPERSAADPLALGAGPIEPVRVAQREEVRERIDNPR